VSVYPQGDTSKEYRLSDFNGGAPLSVALDKGGDLYVMFDTNTSGGSAVNEYTPHAMTGTNLNLTFKWGAGIQVDESGNILVVQQLSPPEILVFAPGQTEPSKTIQEPSGDQPFSLVLDRKNSRLFADDQTANQIDAFAYPSGRYLHPVAGGFAEPTGVAVSPAEFKR
jgi:DNA-binding beta-propeller fold protein YncE